MEDYKDVMLSEPPSRFNGGGAGPSIQAVSLENYKGILLCDRPSNLRAINTGAGLVKAQSDGGLPPFLPSGKAEDHHLGFQPTQEERSKLEMQRNIRKDNPYSSKGSNPALTKHRRWLKSFADAVKSSKLSEAERQLDLQAKLQRIREQQAEMRRQKQQAQQNSNEASNEPAADSIAPTLPPKRKAAPGKSKPKWAMTEDEALDAELDDCAALIKFAQNLNYDQFIQDYEVKEALAIMRDRVKELAVTNKIDLASVEKEADAEVEQDDDLDRLSECPSTATTTARDAFMEAAKQRREERRKAKEEAAATTAAAAAASGQVVHDKNWNHSTQIGGSDVLRNAIQSDSLALADKILANSSSMGKIHTRFSLARLLQNCVLAGRDPSQELAKGSDMIFTGEALAPPREAKISAEATGLQNGDAPQRRILTDLRKAKDKAQNLPYMYRCPSL